MQVVAVEKMGVHCLPFGGLAQHSMRVLETAGAEMMGLVNRHGLTTSNLGHYSWHWGWRGIGLLPFPLALS